MQKATYLPYAGFMKTLPEAIATIEGFYASGAPNRPQRNNNPGNINFAEWTAKPPYNAVMEMTQPTVKPRFAKFPSIQAGFDALTHLLLSDAYRKLTIEQAINRYAPPSENNTQGYVATVCRLVGCLPSDTVEKVMTRA